MLDQKVFLQGINYLKANYLNWAFDLNNDLMIKVWYKKFSNLDAQTFMGMIEKFTEYNKFPPQSPAELLDTLRNEITKQELSPEEAWALVLKLNRSYGFYYGRDKIYKELEDKPVLKKTVEEFETQIANLLVGDTYTPQTFKKAYEINMRRNVETKSAILLGNPIALLLK